MESKRVYYVERQRLTAADLQSEQEYLNGLDLRHNLNQHMPGIIRGLQIRLASGQFQVEPGIAIDSFGHELLLQQAEPLSLNEGAECVDTWLIYCREQSRLRKPGRAPCSENTFERWREAPRVLVTPAHKDNDPELPAEGAVFLGRINCGDRRDIAYTGLRGIGVADPGVRALMQVGPRTDRDPYGFVLRVADESGNLAKRIAMDRRGNNYLFGMVQLLDCQRTLVVPLLQNTLRMMVKASKPGESGKQIQVMIRETQQGNEINLTLIDESGTPQPEVLTVTAGRPPKDIVEELNKKSALATFILVNKDTEPGDENVQLLSVQDDVHAILTSARAMLELADWSKEAPAEIIRRGCYDPLPNESLTDGDEPNGLSFRPVSKPPKGTPRPRIYSVTVQSGDRTIERLRLDLGEKKENDTTVRLSIGAPPQDDTPSGMWLSVSGNCLVSLNPKKDPKDEDEETLPARIEVTGSIEQSPIKPDPTNPLFRDLLVAAWLAGLRSSIQASTTINVTFEQVPQLIETKKPWGYTVRLTNNEKKEITADKLLETIPVSKKAPIRSLGTQVSIPPSSSTTISVSHEKDEIPAGFMDIEIMASGKIGNFPWWKSNEKKHIPVLETPVIDTSDVPDSVPPSATWSHEFTIRNTATLPLTLKEVIVTEDATVRNLLPMPTEILPGGERVVGPVPHPIEVTSDLRIALSMKYQWQNGPEDTLSLDEPKIVKVEQQLQFVEFETPGEIEVERDWAYGLKLKNKSAMPLTEISLKHRLISENLPVMPFVAIPDVPTTLDPNESTLSLHIAGVKAPVSTQDTTVRVEIEAQYERGGRAWLLKPVFSDEIEVTDGS
ncbi:MAG TPA: hypothetical protein VJ464_04360 [Blastocatellia bacterium]|nr:hypothetical protein [Blastocatellia bacterium]